MTCRLAIGWLAWLSPQPVSAVAASPKVVLILSQESFPYADMVLAGAEIQVGIEAHDLKGNSAHASDVLRLFKNEPLTMFLTVGSLATQGQGLTPRLLLDQHDGAGVCISSCKRNHQKLEKPAILRLPPILEQGLLEEEGYIRVQPK